MEPTFSLVFTGRGEDDEEIVNEIPRLDRIPNPCESYLPSVLPERSTYNPNYINTYSTYISRILPNFDISTQNDCEEIIAFLKDIFSNSEMTTEMCDLCSHAFLVECTYKLTELQANSSLTKISILHHVLAEVRPILYSRDDSNEDNQQMCEMLLADTADSYFNYFCEISSKQMWGKTISSESDGSRVILNRELQRMRLMNKYTFQTLNTLVFRRLIDLDTSTSNAGKEELRNIAKENGIKI
jgi:hypothetical protein